MANTAALLSAGLSSSIHSNHDDDDDIISADEAMDDNSDDDNDSEPEDEDAKHKNLLNAISALDGKKKKRQRSEPSQEVSVFNLNTSAVTGKKVRIHELLGTLKSTASHGELKKQLQKIQKKNKKVATPLPKVQADRIQRSIAYESTVKKISKWDHIVQANRRAEHQTFPLYEERLTAATTDDFIKSFKPGNSLEEEIYTVLHGSKFAERPNQELSQAEEDALNAMSVEEAQERRKELQKMRALQSYYETKCRRQGKIKSKKYHRIKRKAKERSEKKQLEELERTDPEAYQQYVQKTEKLRAEERLTLKHKNTGKWAKNVSRFGKYNPDSVKAVTEQLEKSKSLTTKIAGTFEADSEEDVQDDEAEDVASIKPSLSDINNPWFSGQPNVGKKDAKDEAGPKNEKAVGLRLPEIRAERADEDSSESEDEKGRKNLSRPKPVRKVRFFDEQQSSEEEEMEEVKEEKKKDLQPWQPVARRSSVENNKADESDSYDDEDDDDQTRRQRRTASTQSRTNGFHKDETATEEVHVDPSQFFTIEAKTLSSERPDLAVVQDELEEEDDQRLNIQEAFADDDVVAEFSREKLDQVEEDKPKDIDLSLPGWGEWGGAGIIPNQRKKKKKFVIKAAPQAPRKDKFLPNVIINEDRDKKIAMHQVSELPFRYTSVQQFERSIRQPIGQTWNTESSFKKLTKPRVSTKQGVIISPITAEEAFENKEKSKVRTGREISASGELKFSDRDNKRQKNQKKNRKKQKTDQ
ncbi:U3 small nucleolar RNA-associated protein 14 homolog A-like [Ptychodera flava]|uniref:U3 small nucleolar RNA-associated protein 14 homolog A-like n=1 Tax=Ptychodera flava TaxID=63121 RepID=UPI00396A1EBE